MAFAAPVLAERAHVAADRAEVLDPPRRSTDASPVGPHPRRGLAHAPDARLGVRADDVEWDAWRREDGRWTLVARVRRPARPCTAPSSPTTSPVATCVADNDEARLLTGEASPARRARRCADADGSASATSSRGRDATSWPRPSHDSATTRSTWSATHRRRPSRVATTWPPTTPTRTGSPRPPTTHAPVAEPRGARRTEPPTTPSRGRAAAAACRGRRTRPEEGPLLGAELGRDHVRRRQGRLTGRRTCTDHVTSRRPRDATTRCELNGVSAPRSPQ